MHKREEGKNPPTEPRTDEGFIHTKTHIFYSTILHHTLLYVIKTAQKNTSHNTSRLCGDIHIHIHTNSTSWHHLSQKGGGLKRSVMEMDGMKIEAINSRGGTHSVSHKNKVST